MRRGILAYGLGDTILNTPLRTSGGHRGHRILLAAGALLGIGLAASPASAQNFFESLFGRMSPPGNAYADPNQQFNPFGQRSEPRVETGNAVAYCVRTCDGRYFPIQKISGATPAQTCSSFCPASQTKIYRGSTIDHSVGPEGKRYTELSTAFTYREKIVSGCTCNGKDAFGLVTPSIENDPTLRAGDIVATNEGMMAYNGTGAAEHRRVHPGRDVSGLGARRSPAARRHQDHAVARRRHAGQDRAAARDHRFGERQPKQARTGGPCPAAARLAALVLAVTSA